MKVFLSHSSKDKGIVRRIKDDLKSYSYKTWMDEDDIPIGGSIVENIEIGLKESDVLVVFLSQNSTLSKWVKKEWQVKFFNQINEDKVFVLPILLNDCDIPEFLKGRRYLDFRDKDNYESNLSTLLDTLNKLRTEIEDKLIYKIVRPMINYSIFDNTKEILDELEKEYIALPVHKRLPIIETLKKIPRSGKQIRLRSFKPNLQIRTIYDHILSIAHVADCLLPHIQHGIRKEDYAELARCIAFHELNEVVLGDIPTYTTLTPAKRIESRIYAEERLRTVEPKIRKQISNDFVWLFLDEKNRKSFQKVNKILADTKSNIYVTFKMLDKIDPIIATWRYLNVYRGKIGDNPKVFNHKMKDFYENPDVKVFLAKNKVDHLVLDLVNFLQDRTNSWDYYENPDSFFKKNNQLFSLPVDIVKNIIEGIPLFFDNKKNEKT